MKHLVTREEAALVRYVAEGGDPLDQPDASWRIYQPGEGEAIAAVEASGRASCRECGETIEKGAPAILFGFDALADPDGPTARSWARLARAYIHAAPCRDYPEED